jgi:hypothetical protein
MEDSINDNNINKGLPKNIQLSIFLRAKFELEDGAFEGGLCALLRILLSELASRTDYCLGREEMRGDFKILFPLFTRDNAIIHADANDNNDFYWWQVDDINSRLDFLDWMINELKKEI